MTWGLDLLAAAMLAAPAPPEPVKPPNAPIPVYLGTSGAKAKGIFLTRFDPSTGALAPPQLVVDSTNPSFLAVHPRLPVLYAVNEVPTSRGGDSPRISAFSIQPATGSLAPLNDRSSFGAGPCHVAVDPTGRALVVANYTGGNVVSFPLGTDGRIGPASSVLQHAGTGVHPRRQEAPHPHGTAFDPSGRFAFVADLGLDKVLVYRLDGARGTLDANAPPSAPTKAGAGPRHLVVHPSGRFAWAINELDSTIAGFAFDPATGALRATQVVSALPVDFAGTNYPAEIALHPNGRFLYGSNRGHDSLACFSVDPSSGTLALVGHEPARGKWPRHFAFDPSGRFLLAANQKSNLVVVFRVDQETGRLEPTGHAIAVAAPSCVVCAPASPLP